MMNMVMMPMMMMTFGCHLDIILDNFLGGKNLGVHSAIGEGAGVEDKEVLGLGGW